MPRNKVRRYKNRHEVGASWEQECARSREGANLPLASSHGIEAVHNRSNK